MDYVLTVAVSVASGVDNIISALPELNPFRVEIAVGFVILIVIVNLRGVREASSVFAIPTYLFIGSVGVMIVVGLGRTLFGFAPVASSAQYAVQAESLTQAALILLVCARSRAAVPLSRASRPCRTACPRSGCRRSATPRRR